MTSSGAVISPGKPKPEMGILFVLLVGGSVALVSYLPAPVLECWRQLVMRVSAFVGSAAGMSITTAGDILTVNGFAMRIADECTALNYVIILATSMLLYLRHPVGYRMKGILCAVPLVVLANAFRLLVTGLCGTVSWTLFSYVHDYVWVALFALLVFATWKVWADRSFSVGKSTIARVAVVMGSCSLMFVGLVALTPQYASLLAWLGSGFLKIFMWDTASAVALAGSKLQTSYGGKAYEVFFSIEYYNPAVLAGLVLPLQGRGDWQTASLSLFSIIGCLLVNGIFVANSLFMRIRFGDDIFATFWLIEKGLLLATPFALWWIIASGSSSKTAKAKG